CHCSEISKTILTNINPAPTTDQKNDVVVLLQTGKQIMNYSNFDELLLGAEKPSRYIGAEVNAIRKDKAEVHFLLAFPDTYEVGMSHLGLQILYSILNEIPYVAAERCFAPWPDREKQLRDGKIPLTSLESQIPAVDFDIGEGEEVVGEITATVHAVKKSSLNRNNMIDQRAKIPGIYVPAVHGKNQIIKKRNIPDLNLWTHPYRP